MQRRSPCLILFCISIFGCSIPNLETPSCTAARPVVREFYSFHFGNDMMLSSENLKLRERFFTPGFTMRLSQGRMGVDPFTTGTTEGVKAFRVGECEEIAVDQTRFRVLLFWKDDERSEQREINVDTLQVGENWLIDNVSVTPTK